MSPFIESIKIVNGEIFNLNLHLNRIAETQKYWFKYRINLDLKNHIINHKKFKQKGVFKCRVIYDKKIISLDLIPYKYSNINSLAVIHDLFIDYQFKYLNRKNLEQLYSERQKSDDIIIVKNELVTDSYYCNLVFEDKNKSLFTPEKPLLKGVKREFYLHKKEIQAAIIKVSDIKNFDAIYLINSMIDLYEIRIPLSNVYNIF